MRSVGRILKPDAVLVIGTSPLRSRRAEIQSLILVAHLRELIVGSTLPILPVLRHANSLAAVMLGIRTQLLQGSGGPGKVSFTGESVLDWPREIEKGRLKSIFAIGDSMIEAIGSHGVESFENLEFLAVVSDFVTPLVSRADLVLPRLSPFESSGTVINFEGRIRRLDRVIPRPAGFWTLEHFFNEVAQNLESEIPIERSSLRAEIAAEISAFKPILNGPGGMLDRATPIPFRLGEMKHAFDPMEPPRGRFGVVVGETVFQHDTRGKFSPHVSGMPEYFECGICSEDASKLGLSRGDKVRLVGETGGA